MQRFDALIATEKPSAGDLRLCDCPESWCGLMLRDKPSGDREWRTAKVLHQRAQGPLTRNQAQVAEGLFGVHPSTVHRLS